MLHGYLPMLKILQNMGLKRDGQNMGLKRDKNFLHENFPVDPSPIGESDHLLELATESHPCIRKIVKADHLFTKTRNLEKHEITY